MQDLEGARSETGEPRPAMPPKARYLPLVAIGAFGLLGLLALDVHFDGLAASLIDRPVGAWVVDNVDRTTRHFLDGTLTLISDDPVVYPLVAVAAFVVALRGPWRTGLWMVATAGVGGLSVLAVKHIVDRPRPVVLHGLEAAQGFSPAFPSGHTLNAFLGWGLILGVFVYESALRRGSLDPVLVRLNVAVWALIVAVTMLGRVFAGVHWPMDVVGSLLLAGGILSVALWVHLRFVWPHEVRA